MNKTQIEQYLYEQYVNNLLKYYKRPLEIVDYYFIDRVIEYNLPKYLNYFNDIWC